MTLSTADILAMPKIALHDHLDGGLRPQTIIDLAEQAGHSLPATDADALATWFVESADSGSLERYLETFDHTIAVMQTADALARIAREAVVDLARDGVIYAELRYAPEQHLQQGLTLQQVVEAVQEGIEAGVTEAAEEGLGIRAGALLTAMRHADRGLEIAQLTLDNRGTCCVGFDIAGAENGFPPSKHADAFALLRDHHMAVTIHAGEAAGVESISEAIGLGAARRIGHGVRIVEDIQDLDGDDPRLGYVAQMVLDQQIPLELCPTSNEQTGAAASVATHPIHALRDLGFAVTINTDNRLMSGTSMGREIERLVTEGGWTRDQIVEATLTAAWAAFLPYDERVDLAERVLEGFGVEL
ncbi:MAG: adenosine deaminase [Actinobacteria bacterium HGW-Actinobacteria-4]|nr:MAG: adenosine deaminase [Actinobacteria bacterium HGW-Actinobacteria-4]